MVLLHKNNALPRSVIAALYGVPGKRSHPSTEADMIKGANQEEDDDPSWKTLFSLPAFMRPCGGVREPGLDRVLD
jgi:hypothetical protein